MDEETKPIKIHVRASVEERFRKRAMSTYGYSKGSISQAGEAALEHWSACTYGSDASIPKIKDPIKAIDGLLSHHLKKKE